MRSYMQMHILHLFLYSFRGNVKTSNPHILFLGTYEMHVVRLPKYAVRKDRNRHNPSVTLTSPCLPCAFVLCVRLMWPYCCPHLDRIILDRPFVNPAVNPPSKHVQDPVLSDASQRPLFWQTKLHGSWTIIKFNCVSIVASNSDPPRVVCTSSTRRWDLSDSRTRRRIGASSLLLFSLSLSLSLSLSGPWNVTGHYVNLP